MIFIETELKGAFVIELKRLEDERGFFARAWDCQEFQARGLNPRLVQANISFNKKKGTLRGMHYQIPPYEEAKLVRCTRGAIYDAIIDLRPHSPSFKQWLGVELTADNHRMLYIPEGCAHGYLTLEDDTEISYQVSEFYAPEFGQGVRWNDPTFGISWPTDVQIILERDQQYPDFTL